MNRRRHDSWPPDPHTGELEPTPTLASSSRPPWGSSFAPGYLPLTDGAPARSIRPPARDARGLACLIHRGGSGFGSSLSLPRLARARGSRGVSCTSPMDQALTARGVRFPSRRPLRAWRQRWGAGDLGAPLQETRCLPRKGGVRFRGQQSLPRWRGRLPGPGTARCGGGLGCLKRGVRFWPLLSEARPDARMVRAGQADRDRRAAGARRVRFRAPLSSPLHRGTT